jgi:hypothetical protein
MERQHSPPSWQQYFFDAFTIAWSTTQQLNQGTIVTALIYFVLAVVVIVASRLFSPVAPIIFFLLADLLAIWIAGNLINQVMGTPVNQITPFSCVIPLIFFGLPIFTIIKAALKRGEKKEEHKE